MLFIGLAFVAATKAQPALQPVPGLPTKEVYDLHVDRKGYLWIGHGLGLSRYDGLNFVHFTHPGQVTLRTTDIVEDALGRIWCHNFSGQVYYVDQGKMKTLEAYQYKRESQYPRMALCGDELLVTSQWGLFVHNTKTAVSKYVAFARPARGTVSLAVVKGQAFIYDNNGWYSYTPGEGLKSINVNKNILLPQGNTVSLQPQTFNDTLFLIANPSGMLQKLVWRHGVLRAVAQQAFNDYLNAVTVNGAPWIHTRNSSTSAIEPSGITASNLTDVVTGKEGNTWYSSLSNGLMVSYKPTHWKLIQFPIDKDDYVRSLNVGDGYFFAGTQKGNLVVMEKDSGKVAWRHNLFNGYGSIDFIRYYKNHRFLVGSSVNTYIINPKEKKIEDLLPLEAILDVDFDTTTLYLATTSGTYLLPYLEDGPDLQHWKQQQQRFSFYNWTGAKEAPYLFSPHRTRAIRYHRAQQTLYMATKNGLQLVDKSGIRPFYINGKEVFASSLWYQHPRLYIATINDGLWIKENDKLQHFTTANYLFSNTILRLKVTGQHLWLFQSTGIQVFDTKTAQVLQHIDLPVIEGDNVFDVAEKDGFAYLTTAKGIYKIPMEVSVEKKSPQGYLDYVLVNNKDTFYNNSITLPYNENDIQFFFSSPAFYDPAAVSFKYRLAGADAEWQVTKPGERMLRYSSLMPGDYTFEVFAVNKYGVQQLQPISYTFTILRPWWNTWWFVLLVNVFLIGAVLVIIQYRVTQRLKVELIRRSIASDLHDDIGATLSSINIYASLARSEKDNHLYLDLIQQHITGTVARLDDLVWSINPKNDTVEQLVARMQATALPLLQAAGIHCHFYYDKRVLALKLNLAKKRHLYLLFKEMINNVVKHADCKNCYIRLECRPGYIELNVTDDGIGFDLLTADSSRNGLQNMQERAAKISGVLKIQSSEQKGSRLAVAVKV